MCDLKAYVRTGEREDLILEAVTLVKSENGGVVFRNLFGEEKRVAGAIKEVSLVKNRVVVEAS